MSQAEELLNGPTDVIDEITTDEEHLVIGRDRIITVPDSLKTIAVQYDHNIEIVTFDCPRYWDELDMSTMHIYINYMRPDGIYGCCVATNVRVDSSDSKIMHFDWTISRNVTLVKGQLKFLVCIKEIDTDGKIIIHWNSELNKDVIIAEGLECDPIPESDPDIITDLLKKMDNLEKLVNLNYEIVNSIVFSTDSNVNLNIKLNGVGKVRIDYGDNSYDEFLLDGSKEISHRFPGESREQHIILTGADNIREIDLSNNNISEISFAKNSTIEKLVIHDNNLTELDVSNLKVLQYLHMFNNPICLDEIELTKTFSNLTDRANKAFGSIIMYPFYQLGVLVYKSGNTLTKYPNMIDNSSGSPVEITTPVTPVEGKYYRDMTSDTVSWYKYENSEFVPQTEENLLLNLRIKMENITLSLGWLFGSAIQYDEAEYAKCDYFFTQHNIQDYWETAEKGLGVTIGCFDNIVGGNPDFNDINVLCFEDKTGNLKTATDNNQNNHGDCVLSVMASRGKGLYGVAPDSKYYLVGDTSSSLTTDTLRGIVSRLCLNSELLTNSTFKSELVTNDIKNIYQEFSQEHLIFAGAGNNGDGYDWTRDSSFPTDWNFKDYFGDNVIPVIGLDYDDTSYNESTNIPLLGNFSYKDVFADYGGGIKAYSGSRKKYSIFNGNSYACPICTSLVALLQVIYKKINPSFTSFNKNSEFMQFIRIHTNPLYKNMNNAVGNGKIDLMYYNPLIANNSSINVDSINISDISNINITGTSIPSTVSPNNADNTLLTYNFDRSKFAIIDNKIYPLYENSYTETITAYSNMNAGCTSSFNVSVPVTQYKTYEIPDAIDHSAISSIDPTSYTVQIKMSFLPINSIRDKYSIFSGYTEDSSIMATLRFGAYSGGSTIRKTGKFYIMENTGTSKAVLYNTFLFAQDDFDSLVGKDFVFTCTVEDDVIVFYLNGNFISEGKLAGYKFPMSKITINTGILKNNIDTDVRYYPRVLTQEEIVENTAALLNNNGVQPTNKNIPVKGVDYWTDADKAEIKSYVDDAILGGAW